MGTRANTIPIVNKTYCSSSQVVLVVRRRPHVTNGGGFVVTDCNQKVIFRVDGCGILGTKDELILRDGDGNGDALLLIRRKVPKHTYTCMHHHKQVLYACINLNVLDI